jgi:hypothetical protein
VRSGGITPHISNTCFKWKWAVSFTPQPGNNPNASWTRVRMQPRGGNREKSLNLTGNRPPSVTGHPPRIPVTIPTQLMVIACFKARSCTRIHMDKLIRIACKPAEIRTARLPDVNQACYRCAILLGRTCIMVSNDKQNHKFLQNQQIMLQSYGGTESWRVLIVNVIKLSEQIRMRFFFHFSVRMAHAWDAYVAVTDLLYRTSTKCKLWRRNWLESQYV